MARRNPGESDLSEGTRLLDRYSILDRIGSGGMATIYRAMDDRLRRVVCVKLLRTTLVEGSGSNNGSRAVYQATYTHFLQEALALSRLSHPNTLRIYDFGYVEPKPGEAQGAPFHVSEYLDGGNLESHVRARGPLPAQEAFGILVGICEAVAEAHEHGIIHRDIKPSNILFARVRGELVAKLADFGIAHSDVKKQPLSPQSGPSESVSTVALFSPRWAAPEQLCGSPEGPRTDVYALGLLTVFMLTGKVLFGDDDVRLTFNDRVRGDVLVTSRLQSLGLGGEVARVLAQALLARREDRIATAPEFAQCMRAALKVRLSNSVAPFPVEVVARSTEMPEIADPGQPLVLGASQESLPERGSPPTFEDTPQSTRGAESFAGFGGDVPPPSSQRQRAIRYVQVHEKLDLSFVDVKGEEVRLRVTMLPGQTMSLNVKGLSCFIAKRGGRPTPAVSVTQDTVIDLVSTARTRLGELTLAFGEQTANGHLFVVDGRQLLITYAEAQQVVVLMLSHGSDIVVMCRT